MLVLVWHPLLATLLQCNYRIRGLLLQGSTVFNSIYSNAPAVTSTWGFRDFDSCCVNASTVVKFNGYCTAVVGAVWLIQFRWYLVVRGTALILIVKSMIPKASVAWINYCVTTLSMRCNQTQFLHSKASSDTINYRSVTTGSQPCVVPVIMSFSPCGWRSCNCSLNGDWRFFLQVG